MNESNIQINFQWKNFIFYAGVKKVADLSLNIPLISHYFIDTDRTSLSYIFQI